MSTDAIVLHALDTVATLLRPVAAGETLSVAWPGGETRALVANEAVPLCHKLALRPLAAGDEVRKYGAPIGRMVVAVAAGGHVHVHNMHSLRARQEGRDDG